MQKASSRRAKVPNPNKASRGNSPNQRTSIGNAKARSRRSVRNAERHSTGPIEIGARSMQNAVYAEPRSRIHSGKARKNQGMK